jgi:hypothetical protein
MVRGQDRNNVSLDTATPAQNVWSIVFLRPSRDPEHAARQAHDANTDLVNNIFVSVFTGNESDRVATDFWVIRILAELLLHGEDGRRFLQTGLQNAYPTTCVVTPSRPPAEGASAVLRRALSETLVQLEERGVRAAGSPAISSPAEHLRELVRGLVQKARASAEVKPPAEKPDEELEATLNGLSTSGYLRPADGSAEIRRRLNKQITRERGRYADQGEVWERHRASSLESFSGVNKQIGDIISDISGAAVSSRGNDISVLARLIEEVNNARESLKTIAQSCRMAMTSAGGDGPMASQPWTRVEQAERTVEFELEQVTRWQSVLYFFTVSLLAILVPLCALIATRTHYWPAYFIILLLLAAMWIVSVWTAVKRRRDKMRQAAIDLGEQFETWRQSTIERFNHALLYQAVTLAVGWLTSIAEKLEQIGRSIVSRTTALQSCREMIDGAELLQPRNLEKVSQLVDRNADRLRTFTWDKWIVEFLTERKAANITGEARINYANDGVTQSIPVPGLDGTIKIVIKTPDSLYQASTPATPTPATPTPKAPKTEPPTSQAAQ